MRSLLHILGLRGSPNNYRSLFVLFSLSFLAIIGFTALLFIAISASLSDDGYNAVPLSLNPSDAPTVVIKDGPDVSESEDACSYWNCFDVYQCKQQKMSIWVYPLQNTVDSHGVPAVQGLSREWMEVLEAVVDSEWYTADRNRACIYMPSIDLLNQNRVRLREAGLALAQLKGWNGGINHLLWNFVPGTVPDYSTILEVPRGKAMVAGGGFSSYTYRSGFDVSLPVFNPYTAEIDLPAAPNIGQWLVVAAQINLHPEYYEELSKMAAVDPELLLLSRCGSNKQADTRCQGDKTYPYPHILQEASFCLVLRSARLGQSALFDAMKAGCIPVIIADSFIMPFSEVLDWTLASVRIHEEQLKDIMKILRSFREERIVAMRKQVTWLFHRYFSTIRNVTHTALRILNNRIFPLKAITSKVWNTPQHMRRIESPFSLPMIPPRTQGFTAVILTYDRWDSLLQVISTVIQAPSLTKVLVVWNNQKKPPPQASVWPKLSRPLKVVQTPANKLSNRFYPYPEIETEAVLAIDDDIVMLTADELEFAYEVWREFPDRIVGFPSRTHVWDNTSISWKYESEWTNEVSMVLTGAAFYHKYWSFLYSTSMPAGVKDWVDDQMNCEDIAMNFLVANFTGKAPIKVAPRKKFKCPECTSADNLSADLSHLAERSRCINRFVEAWGYMPLKSVQFRADPVLYKENLPDKLKRFPGIGSL